MRSALRGAARWNAACGASPKPVAAARLYATGRRIRPCPLCRCRQSSAVSWFHWLCGCVRLDRCNPPRHTILHIGLGGIVMDVFLPMKEFVWPVAATVAGAFAVWTGRRMWLFLSAPRKPPATAASEPSPKPHSASDSVLWDDVQKSAKPDRRTRPSRYRARRWLYQSAHSTLPTVMSSC